MLTPSEIELIRAYRRQVWCNWYDDDKFALTELKPMVLWLSQKLLEVIGEWDEDDEQRWMREWTDEYWEKQDAAG